MKAKHVKLILLAIVALAIAAFLIPASPFYLSKFRDKADGSAGKSKEYWIEKLNDADPAVRLEAITTLGQFGPEAKGAAPALAKVMLEDSDRVHRNEAAFSLARMGDPSSVAAFARALEDEEPIIRLNACLGLSRLKTDARPALPALYKALKDKANDTNAKTYHFTIQEMAAITIGRATTGTPEALPALIDALAVASSPEMRRAVARAFAEIGPEAKPAAPQLRQLLNDKIPFVKAAAADAMKAVGLDPKEDMSDPKASGPAKTDGKPLSSVPPPG